MLRRTLLLAGCLLALALGVAACGDDDDDGDNGAAATTEQTESSEAAGNIVAVAAETPELSTLVDAVTAAELVETLEEPGPYTVFAPTNE
ncbi:MAG TPA: fasciclin domain-containing protein, partial [Thermoanaerobaculia bacterium]|nr:fasciclin domain-containing protein [Thermoanaerobaculia bacterium]